jgi:hypothetical protein
VKSDEIEESARLQGRPGRPIATEAEAEAEKLSGIGSRFPRYFYTAVHKEEISSR